MSTTRTILLLQGDAEATLLADAGLALEALFADGSMQLVRARSIRPDWLDEAADVPADQLAAVQAVRALLAQPHRLAIIALLPAIVGVQGMDPAAAVAALEPHVESLLARGTAVAVSNTFRHVREPLESRAAAGPAPLRERIRELNLQLARLSQRTGCFVLDLDRPLAQEGGATLGADCFGGEGRAAEIALDEFAALVLDALPDDVAGLEAT